jgi:hypothetical protein
MSVFLRSEYLYISHISYRLGLGGAAVCDVCITVLLVWKLYRIETENQATRRYAYEALDLRIYANIAQSATANIGVGHKDWASLFRRWVRCSNSFHRCST